MTDTSVPVPELAGPPADRPLDADERAELDRLRREVTQLRTARPPRRRMRWRSFFAVVLIVLGAILAPVSVLGIWASNQISQTDRFVATVSPLAADPAIQAAVTDRVTTAVVDAVDVQQLATQAVDELSTKVDAPRLIALLHQLPGPLASGVQSFVHDKVGEFVASPQFQQVWDRTATFASEQLVGVLSGSQSAITIKGDQAVLDLGPVVDAVKQRLVADGFGVAANIPDLHPTIPIMPAQTLVRAQNAYQLLTTLALVLPWLALLCLAVGVYLARNHRRATIAAVLSVVAGMLVLGIGLLIVRGVLLSHVPSQSAAAADSAYDIVVNFLRVGLRTVAVVGLVVALGAFLTGPARSAVWIRRSVVRGIGKIRPSQLDRNPHLRPVTSWIHTHRGALRIAAVLLAAATLVLVDHPTTGTVIVVVVILLVVLALIEFLGQGPAAPAEEPGAPQAAEIPLGTGLAEGDATAAAPAGPSAPGEGTPTSGEVVPSYGGAAPVPAAIGATAEGPSSGQVEDSARPSTTVEGSS